MVKKLKCRRPRFDPWKIKEDPLEKGMATHCSILAWKIPWTEEPGSYSPWSHKESNTTEVTKQPNDSKTLSKFPKYSPNL